MSGVVPEQGGGDASAANQTSGAQKTQIVDAGGEQATVTGGRLDVNATVTPSGTQNVDVVANTIGLATGAKQDLLLAELQLKADLTETQPVSAASLPLPAGAATSALQGTGNTSLATIAGAVAGTEMQVDVLTMPTTTVQATNLDIRDLTFAADKVDVSGSTGVGVTGTFFQATQPISASALPLPSGAATEATLSAIDAGIPAALGQATMANSMPVVVASNQTAIPISGTVTVDTSLLATSANQATEIASLSILDDWDESDRAKVNLIVGQAGIAAGTGVDGVTVPRVTLATNVALPAGTNNIGDVDILSIAAGDNNIGNVDVVTLPSIPAGNNNIGDVDVASIAAGTNYIGKTRLTDGTTDAEVVPLAGYNAQAVAIVDASGNQIASFGGGTQYTDGDAQATPVGTVAMGTDGANIFAAHMDTSGDLQVDVLTMPTTTVQATNLDIRDLTFAADKVDASGTILGAGNNNIGDVDVASVAGNVTVVQPTGTNLHAVIDSGTLTTVSTVTSVTAIANALPAGNNNIGDVDIASGTLTAVTSITNAVTVAQATAANLNMTEASASAIRTAVETIDNAVSGAGFNITQVGGTNIDTNSGNKSAGTQRMVIATDQPNLTTPLNVDTELPSAAALADATANPTTTSVGSLNMGYNGSTWDRVRTQDSAIGNIRTIEYEGELGTAGGMTGLKDRLIAERYTVLADSLADGIAAFWTQVVANGGTVTSTGGEGRLLTSTAVNGSSKITSPLIPYYPGQVAWMNSAIRFGDSGTAGNIRRLGMFTTSGDTPQEGFYYELTGTTLNAVTVKAGVATAVASTSWTRFATAPYTLDTNYVSFEIRYTANSVWFYVNNVLRHVVAGTTASLTSSLSLPITVQNVKTSGGTDITFAVRNIGNGSFGKPGGRGAGNDSNAQRVAIARPSTSYCYNIPSQVHVAVANTVHWDMFNADASVIIRVVSIRQIPNITTAVVGIVFDWLLERTTAVGTGGSTLTSWLADTMDTALDADVTARSKPTGGATQSTDLFNYAISSEETSAATIMVASLGGLELVPPQLQPNFGGKGIVLRQNQGLRCVQVTNSNAGNTGWLISFIQDGS